jgi:hypothetical protein
MRDVKRRNIGLSALYIATLAVMDGFGVRRGTGATVAAVLTILALSPATAALAQSAGDRQYADPLVTDGQSSPSSQGDGASGGDTPTSAPATPAPAPDTPSSTAAETAAAPQAALPRTGAEPLALAATGLALAACGALGLALPRRARHARD